MSNYPCDIRSYDDNPNSPFFDDSGLESAHIEAMEAIEEDEDKIAEIISELRVEEYNKLISIFTRSLGKVERLMIDHFHDSEPAEFQKYLATYREDLHPEAALIIEEAISEAAMAEVLN